MRIERIELRSGFAARPIRAGAGPVEPPAHVTVVELAGTGPGDHLRDRLADLRIYLGQLTWYLFNAEGWR
ncbi:MAG: hypothetical protein WEF51_03270 [Chloroflexota bacterium]